MRTTSKYLSGGHRVSEFRLSAGGKPLRYKAKHGLRGFTIVELMIVVAIIGLLAAIAVPNYARGRKTARLNLCVSNLRQLDDCKHEWALEFKKNNESIPTVDDIVPYLRSDRIPECPASGTYRLRRVLVSPVCSLSPAGHTLNPDDDGLSD